MNLLRRYSGKKGFTLVEVMMAAAISVVVIGGATIALISSIRTWRAEGIRSDLHMDLEIALERISSDLRLSSVGIGLMAFYPADATRYTAISFPRATPGADNLLPRDENDQIMWDTTVIYHVRPGSPDELIRTTFHPRNLAATPEELYYQLEATVTARNTAELQYAAMDGEDADSRTVFRNLVEMFFRPPDVRFDGYAPDYKRTRTFNWGSLVLSNGVHELTFNIRDKNPDSTGYKIGIDRFSLSYSGSPREGEIFLPENGHPTDDYYSYDMENGVVGAEDMSGYGASWSGNSQLTFIPQENVYEVSSTTSITFYVENDLWCDANFNRPPGVLASNCSRRIARNFTNYYPHIPDTVVSMNDGISWDALNVTTDPLGVMSIRLHRPYADEEDVRDFTNVVNIVKGSNEDYSAIQRSGAWVRFKFRAGPHTGGLTVRNPRIKRRGGTSIHDLSFNGAQTVDIPPSSSKWTDWFRYEIDRNESYELLWQRGLGDGASKTSVVAWPCQPDNIVSLIDGDEELFKGYVVGLESMEVRVPSNAVYRSGVFDTRINAPTYRRLVWTPYYPSGVEGDLVIRVRSADSPLEMENAFWSSYFYQNDGNNNISFINGGRYVQYEALFSAWGDHLMSPMLRDVTITWDAPTGIVDLTVDFAKGPDYGIVRADVNGQSFIKGIEVDLTIFRDGPFGTETVSGSKEVRPLNTGR